MYYAGAERILQQCLDKLLQTESLFSNETGSETTGQKSTTKVRFDFSSLTRLNCAPISMK